MSRTACIVQARMASTRLPGKVMLTLAGRTVLDHVLTRCRAIPGVDVVVCATVDEPACDPLAAEAERAGAVVFRGSERDVLGRYAAAAAAAGAERILRVTSDCPLIDPDVCGGVLDLLDRSGAPFATNNTPPGFPHGLDCEAFYRGDLDTMAAAATEPYDREHVTPWLRRAAGDRLANLPGPGGAWASWRWTLDFPEDFTFFEAVFRHLPAEKIPNWRMVAELVASRPELQSINSMHRQR